MKRPVFTIIAGSNGCGKSALTSVARNKFQHNPVLDPDAIAKSLQATVDSDKSDIQARKDVLSRCEEAITKRESFTVETTLSGSTYLKMATRAKAAGFLIFAVFIGTSSVEINLERVKARVELGGHDVLEEDQRRRYPRTLANMQMLLRMAEVALIFDNSTEQGHVLIGMGHAAEMHWIEPVPQWAAFLRN